MNRAQWKNFRGMVRAWNSNPANGAGSFENLTGRGRIYRDAVPCPLLRDLSPPQRAAVLIGKPEPQSGRLPLGPRALAFLHAVPLGGQFKGMALMKRVAYRRALRGEGIQEIAA